MNAFNTLRHNWDEYNGAAEKTRTSTGFTPQRPQRCASTNSATAAHLRKNGVSKVLGDCKGKYAHKTYFLQA